MPLEAKTAGTSKIAKNFFKKDQTTNLDQTEKITFIEQMVLYPKCEIDEKEAAMASVTKFGKISPLWQNFGSIWLFNEGWIL